MQETIRGRAPDISYPEAKKAKSGIAIDENPTATTKQVEVVKVYKPRHERDVLDLTFKELFFCVRSYDNSSTGSVPAVYSLPTQLLVLSALDFLVSFGRVGQRRKKVLGSWISHSR